MDILIIKTGALGDVLRSSFIAQGLKEKYQKSSPKIFWITEKNASDLIKNNPFVDKIILEKEKDKIINKKFELIINLEESEELVKFASKINASEKVGFFYKKGKIFPTPRAKEWFDMSALGKKPENDLLKKENKKTHRKILAEIVGIKEKYEPYIKLNKEQKEIKKEFMRRYGLSEKDLIIGLNLGSGDKWPKELPIKKCLKLIEQINKNYSAKIILFGGPNEKERNNEIISKTKFPLIDSGSGNNLKEFPALIDSCKIIITTDSLGLHLALALKKNTICLVGPTSPTELDMYNLGEKVIADSKCICCYKKDCKSMEKISIKKIMICLEKIINKKITLLITAYKEKEIEKTLESCIGQKTQHNYEIILAAPDKETLERAKKFSNKIKIVKDPGKGKSFALNYIFKKIETDILILTDGDVTISPESVEEINNLFLDPQIGCVTGRPIPSENKKTKFGFWANFLFDMAHKIRNDSFKEEKFIECSGYLFAFRKNKIKEIPLDVAEDTIIPYIFWSKGYKIGYVENAKVYVKNPRNLKDWIEQKTRTSKAHETLEKYVNTKQTPRVKTFKTEARGIKEIFTYPSNIKEIFWLFQLILARLYMWGKVFIDTKFLSKNYHDAWKRVESTK